MRAFVIAGTQSGCGKTTVSIGIMAALIQRGLKVQAFKIGPDFIDTGHHRQVTGRDSHNLDGWMMSRQYNQEIFSRHTRDTDIAVIEGVMGLFDGLSGRDESGSTAQMARWLDVPVVLIIDARSMARSAAAIALGFSLFDRGLSISGVIFNRVASRGHAKMLMDAMESVPDIQVFGCLPRDSKIEMPSRHLGLVTREDFGIGEQGIKELGQWVEGHVDLDLLLSCAPEKEIQKELPASCPPSSVRIGIAMDEAFCFYYAENLRLLTEAGAELVPFSPIYSRELPPDIRGIILGGGYPELHCQELAENQGMLTSIKRFAMYGGPVYAECGGFMYLTRDITDFDGNIYPMAGIFPFSAKMESHLHALGYREVITKEDSILGPAGTRIRGHEFHYSRTEGNCCRSIYLGDTGGFLYKRVLGSYVHLHLGSNPEVARHFVRYCMAKNFGL
ncbi:MAG: cobyrinate a,c-diamide synthase [Nitrospiraceae bacterium]|nr:cobyrinate a,c-diamide synthase [Nitrospiraceae bacterium]